MTLKREFQTIILPVLKGAPFILVLIILVLIFSSKVVKYITPQYQAKGVIKIDNRDLGVEDFQLYNQTVSSPGISSNPFLTEVEILKSSALKSKVIDLLDLELALFRVGRLKTTELYKNSPIIVKYQKLSEKCYDQTYHLRYGESGTFYLMEKIGNEAFVIDTVSAEKPFNDGSLTFSVSLDSAFLSSHPGSLITGDQFAFQVQSKSILESRFNNKNLLVKIISKDINLVNIYYKDPIAERAKDFTNALMKTYIDESTRQKTKKASETLRFINAQVEDVLSKLKRSENLLSDYKRENRVINSTQETDANLNKQIQLDMQRIRLGLQIKELEQLFAFIASGQSLMDFAPNFETLRDPVFKSSFVKVQEFELKRKDLLLLYAQTSDEVRTIDEKIDGLRVFLSSSVNQTLETLRIKNEGIEKDLEKVRDEITQLPLKEKNLASLEREVKLKENIYNFLIRKKMELDIAKASPVSQNEIVDKAKLPSGPVSPNKPLIYGVAFFMAFLTGCLFSYLYQFFKGKIEAPWQLKSFESIPYLASVPLNTKSESQLFPAMLISRIKEKIKVAKKDKTGLVITVGSWKKSEGKKSVSQSLARGLENSGYRVLLVSNNMGYGHSDKASLLDAINSKSYEVNPFGGHAGLSRITLAHQIQDDSSFFFSGLFQEALESLKEEFDLIVFETPKLNSSLQGIGIQSVGDLNLIIVRSGFTSRFEVMKLYKVFVGYDIKNTYSVLNAFPKSHFSRLNWRINMMGKRKNHGNTSIPKPIISGV